MADFDGRLRIRVLQLAQLDSQMWTSMVSGGNDCLEFLNRVSDVRFVSGRHLISNFDPLVVGIPTGKRVLHF